MSKLTGGLLRSFVFGKLNLIFELLQHHIEFAFHFDLSDIFLVVAAATVSHLLEYRLAVAQVVLHRLEDFLEVIDEFLLLVLLLAVHIVLLEGTHDLDIVVYHLAEGLQMAADGIQVYG